MLVGCAVRSEGIARFSLFGKGAHGTPYSNDDFNSLNGRKPILDENL